MIKAKFFLKLNATAKLSRTRPVPHALKPAMDSKVDRLINLGILEPLEHNEWETPIVIVPKKGNTVQICGDFRVTCSTTFRRTVHKC